MKIFFLFLTGGVRGGGGCTGSACRIGWIVAGSVIGGLFALAAIIFLIVWCCRRRQRHQSSDSNMKEAFLDPKSSKSNTSNYETYSDDFRKNGTWTTRYNQYGKWHGPHRVSLNFDRNLNQVAGKGSDDVGQFVINGYLSADNQSLSLRKTYESGTGDVQENFGHTVTLQLTWNPSHSQFEGKWSVSTSRYAGDGQYELKFDNYSE